MIWRSAIAIGLLAGPAFGQGFQLPPSCEPYLTVQSADCNVSHHFTCEGDASGTQRRVDIDERGLIYQGQIDDEGQWLASDHFLSGHQEALADDPADPQSLTELFETGADSWDIVTSSDEIGSTRYMGGDTLTGERVTIDGIDLLRTEYTIRAVADDGTEIWSARGQEYVSETWRMFLGGSSTVTTTEGTVEEPDGSPVEFIFPGERGFMSENPKYGCGIVKIVR